MVFQVPVMPKSGLIVIDNHLNIETAVFSVGTGMGSCNEQVLFSAYTYNGLSKGIFICSDDFVQPGTGVGNVRLFFT